MRASRRNRPTVHSGQCRCAFRDSYGRRRKRSTFTEEIISPTVGPEAKLRRPYYRRINTQPHLDCPEQPPIRPARQAGPQRSEEELDGRDTNAEAGSEVS